MNTTSQTSQSSPIEDQIQQELNSYKAALKSDEEFFVLKAIKEKIKMLEDQLRQRQRSFLTFK